jgi:DamX protein
VDTETTTATVANLTIDEKAILKAPAHEYTLQLSNAPSEQGAINYIQRHHLAKAAKIYSRQLNGQRTYTVIYGHYSSRNAALAALHKLPTSIQKAKPWPRTLASVQAEIRMRDRN